MFDCINVDGPFPSSYSYRTTPLNYKTKDGFPENPHPVILIDGVRGMDLKDSALIMTNTVFDIEIMGKERLTSLVLPFVKNEAKINELFWREFLSHVSTEQFTALLFSIQKRAFDSGKESLRNDFLNLLGIKESY